jgi:hypothetical protein
LLVSPWFRRSQTRVLQHAANVGTGTLACIQPSGYRVQYHGLEVDSSIAHFIATGRRAKPLLSPYAFC